jgi:Flp pilus assembly protein TadG
MKKFFARFARDRRAAIAFIFAGALLPLVMLIGLSIDYSFYVQARSQFGLAADAAATYSLREASAVYTLETTKESPSLATTAAISEGETAGADWFTAQIATLPKASVSGGSPTVTLASTTAASGSSTTSAGFSATVGYDGTYPPFFNSLFKKTSNWHITGTTGATTQYQYLELLILMDDSGSMNVSADIGNNNPTSTSNPGGILTMDDNTVCIPNAYLNSSATGFITSNGLGAFQDEFYAANPLPAGQTNVTWSDVQNVTNNTSVTATSATSLSPTPLCAANTNGSTGYTTTKTVVTMKNGKQQGNPQVTTSQSSTNVNSGPTTSGSGSTTTTTTVSSASNSIPDAPCAFACHTTNNTYTATGLTYVNGSLSAPVSRTYPGDLYGLARQLGVLLKTDVVLQSTEAMLTTMENTEQIPSQFSVGLYTFDADYCPLVKGTTGDPLPEATTNLTSALSSIRANDWTYTPGESAFPPTVSDANGNTNFPLSVSDLIHGTMTTSGTNCANTTNLKPLAAPATTSSVGTVPTNPDKFIFIITDGMEDQHDNTTFASGQSTICGRVGGEMTGILAESQDYTSPTAHPCDLAVCTPLKNLGYTIYVLYVPYPAIQNTFYYGNGLKQDPYITDDFSMWTQSSNPPGTPQIWNEGISGTNTTPVVTPSSPNIQALKACASTTNNQLDFYIGGDSTTIANDMNEMLASALSSAVRITQ